MVPISDLSTLREHFSGIKALEVIAYNSGKSSIDRSDQMASHAIFTEDMSRHPDIADVAFNVFGIDVKVMIQLSFNLVLFYLRFIINLCAVCWFLKSFM